MELREPSRLATRSVTVSPSRHRSSGAGIWPLTATPVRAAPVKFTGVASICRSNSVPVRTLRGDVSWACTRLRGALSTNTPAPAPYRKSLRLRRGSGLGSRVLVIEFLSTPIAAHLSWQRSELEVPSAATYVADRPEHWAAPR